MVPEAKRSGRAGVTMVPEAKRSGRANSPPPFSARLTLPPLVLYSAPPATHAVPAHRTITPAYQ